MRHRYDFNPPPIRTQMSGTQGAHLGADYDATS